MRIQVNYHQLRAYGNQIDSYASDYEKEYQKLFSEIALLKQGWQGEDHQVFVNQIEGFRSDFNKMKLLMNEYATFLKQSANAYEALQQDRVAKARQLCN